MQIDKEPLSTTQKALKINLDASKYGTFAEIGAGLNCVVDRERSSQRKLPSGHRSRCRYLPPELMQSHPRSADSPPDSPPHGTNLALRANFHWKDPDFGGRGDRI
jgi:hypothetical protein